MPLLCGDSDAPVVWWLSPLPLDNIYISGFHVNKWTNMTDTPLMS